VELRRSDRHIYPLLEIARTTVKGRSTRAAEKKLTLLAIVVHIGNKGDVPV
jgi:hypothetical protein